MSEFPAAIPAAGRPAIVDAGPCDVALLAELSRQCFASETTFVGAPWTARLLAEILALPGSFALLAVQGDQPVGFLLGQALFDDCEIHSLGVRPGSRRAGHARRLLEAAAAAAAARGACRLLLEVADSNAAARALYAALGFAETGRRRNYYRRADGTPVDAVTCACSLRTGVAPA